MERQYIVWLVTNRQFNVDSIHCVLVIDVMINMDLGCSDSPEFLQNGETRGL